jgi:hypothetical protein
VRWTEDLHEEEQSIMKTQGRRQNRNAIILAMAMQLALLVIAPAAWADEDPSGSWTGQIPSEYLTQQFMSAHPDLKYRQIGMHAFDGKRFSDAFKYFQRAAYYSDKPSQGMLAEMLWNGNGMAPDHASAYIWMDLAAERGYTLFVQERERYWSLLSDAEKAAVTGKGAEIRSVYADSAAKPRIAQLLRWARRDTTGSHLGSTAGSALTIIAPGPGGSSISIDGSRYYAPEYWDPKQYQAWQDRIWKTYRAPRVDVGEIEQVEKGTPAPATRLPEAQPDVDAKAPPLPENPR